jgi:hypothetical protein
MACEWNRRSSSRAVAHVALHRFQRLSGDALDARQRLRAAVAEVVEHHEAVTRALERHTGVGTDVAGAAGDEQGGGFRACRHGTVRFGAWVAIVARWQAWRFAAAAHFTMS